VKLERGVPYWIGGGRYLEDLGYLTRAPDHLSLTLQRAYLVEERFDPLGLLVLDAETGKTYRISDEAWFRSLVVEGGHLGKVVKEVDTHRTMAEKAAKAKVVLLPQEWV
jgi:hypothetical protein